jgi:hypothetical protein
MFAQQQWQWVQRRRRRQERMRAAKRDNHAQYKNNNIRVAVQKRGVATEKRFQGTYSGF